MLPIFAPLKRTVRTFCLTASRFPELDVRSGLIGLSDDVVVLISPHANDRGTIPGLINKSGRAIVPVGIYERPHPQFFKWHREKTFKH